MQAIDGVSSCAVAAAGQGMLPEPGPQALSNIARALTSSPVCSHPFTEAVHVFLHAAPHRFQMCNHGLLWAFWRSSLPLAEVLESLAELESGSSLSLNVQGHLSDPKGIWNEGSKS